MATKDWARMGGDAMMIKSSATQHIVGCGMLATLAMLLCDCSAQRARRTNIPNDHRADKELLVERDTVALSLDTILIRDVQFDNADSAYVMSGDTASRVMSLRMFAANTSFVLSDSLDLRPKGRAGRDPAYALYDITNSASFAVRSMGRVDVEIVVAASVPWVELAINCPIGGPDIADGKRQSQVMPLLCAGPWPIQVDSGWRVQTRVYPARPSGAQPIRTSRWGPGMRDTITQISWNCLRDDGANAGKGRYMVQIMMLDIRESGRRIRCRYVDVVD